MIKIALICNTESLAFPTVHYLNESGLLGEIFILNRSTAVLTPQLTKLGVPQQGITLLDKKNWVAVLENRLVRNTPDMVWVFGFPWKIPSSVLDIPPLGFLNFHFGLLPKYKGADPIFWQIRNGEATAGLTIHRMTADIDGGPVLHTVEVPLFPGETFGLFSQRIGNTAARMLPEFLDYLRNGTLTEKPLKSSEALYLQKPSAEQLSINWETQTAAEIERLVNASNPRYGGAAVSIRNLDMSILEVTPADITDIAGQSEPGLIVYADAVYGLIVACRNNEFLRINILHSADGYLSGVKLFSMGIKPGDKFKTIEHHQRVSLS